MMSRGPVGEIMAGLVVDDAHPDLHLLALQYALGDVELDRNRRALLPLVGDLGDGVLAAQPLLDERDVFRAAFERASILLGPFEFAKERNDLVGTQETVAAVLAVVTGAVVVHGIPGGGVSGRHQRHVALAALDGRVGDLI